MQKQNRLPSVQPNATREFSLKCQCTLQRNNLPLKLNSKSKYFSLVLRPPRHLLILPFSKSEVLMEFDVARIRSIQRRFIEEGKLTVEVYEGSQPLIMLGTDFSHTGGRKELLTHIFIHNSIQQSLELFVERIANMQKELKRKSVINEMPAAKTSKESVLMKEQSKPPKRTVSRRELMKEAQEQEQKLAYEQLKKAKVFQQKRVIQLEKKKLSISSSLGLDVLPIEVFRLVISYVGMCQLGLRVLSRKLSDYVLNGVTRIRLQDQVDEPTFKKLTRRALYVECRMKNVRDIDHFTNLSEIGPIDQYNSRWLNFSKWREVSAKNIDQLKGLRLYCLELPYALKFESQCLIGLKLVCLKLKGNSKGVQQRNSNITDANIVMMINLCPHLTMLEIACVGQDLLEGIKQPQKMIMLRIGTLELSRTPSTSSIPWYDLRTFSSLEDLSVKHCVDHQQRAIGELPSSSIMNFPSALKRLKLGAFANIPTLMNDLPAGMEEFSLAGDHIRNEHISEVIDGSTQIYLPNIKVLDIRECPAVTMEGLYNCRGIRLKTRWEDYTVQACTPFFFERSITLLNERPRH